MIKTILLLFVLSINFILNAQIPKVGRANKSEVGTCYEKSVQRRKNLKYAEWECGKRAGIIDCNEKLSYDEDHNTFTAGIDGTPFNGICETCHNNGMLERTVYFVNGKEDGQDTTTYESGCPMVIRNHITGIRNGVWTYFYDSTSQVAWEINYFVGKQHGRAIFFRKNGDTTLWENYNDGLLHGQQRTYFPEDSKIQKISNYVNGNLNGKFLMFNEDGIIVQDLIYKMGVKDGNWKYYYDDGTLLRTENWVSNVKEGEFKTFFYEGHIQDQCTYKKGRLEGWSEEYYFNKKLKHRTLYKKGVVLQEFKYDIHGKETYRFGVEEDEDGDAEDDTVMDGRKKKKRKKSKK